MNPICNYCDKQRSDNRGGVQCGATSYRYHEGGYGPFKNGAVCVHDADLENHFTPISSESSEVAQLSETIDRLRNKNSELKYEKSVLEQRLISVAQEGSDG